MYPVGAKPSIMFSMTAFAASRHYQKGDQHYGHQRTRITHSGEEKFIPILDSSLVRLLKAKRKHDKTRVCDKAEI